MKPVVDSPEARQLAAIQAQMQRPAKQVNIDGSFELGWASMLLIGGAIPLLNAVLPKSFWSSGWSWLSYLPLACMVFAPYALPKVIKRVITWPRTGYVADVNEVKFSQLLKLMGFGLALGFGVALVFIFISELNGARHENVRGSMVRHGIEIVACFAVVAFLGRKVVHKRKLPPTAYDPHLMNQALGQTAAGRRHLRWITFALVLLFISVPFLLGAIAFGVGWLGSSMARHPEVGWSKIGAVALMGATNAVLYLMGNALMIRQQRWKWLVIAILAIGTVLVPVVVGPLGRSTEWTVMLDFFPPSATLFMGFVWFTSGVISLCVFVRAHPLATSGVA